MTDTYIDSVQPMNLGWEPFFDGQYWQPITPEVVQERRNKLNAILGGVSSGNRSLQEYQQFAELDWRRPHGHFRTALEMEKHFIEEYHELHDANDKLVWDIGLERPAKEQDPIAVEEAISELGDILWFTSAFAPNCAVSIENEWTRRLYEDLHINTDSATIRSVDERVDSGYIPRVGLMELDEDPMHDLLFAVGFICTNSVITIQENDEKYNFAVENRQRALGFWTSHAIGLITLKAQWIGSSLSGVIDANIRKISRRVETNTIIDKSNRQENRK